MLLLINAKNMLIEVAAALLMYRPCLPGVGVLLLGWSDWFAGQPVKMLIDISWFVFTEKLSSGIGQQCDKWSLIGCLTSQQLVVYLWDGSAQTILCAATLR